MAVCVTFSGAAAWVPRFRRLSLIGMAEPKGVEFLQAIREHANNYPAWQVFTFAEFVDIKKQWEHETGAACVIRPRVTNRAKYGTK